MSEIPLINTSVSDSEAACSCQRKPIMEKYYPFKKTDVVAPIRLLSRQRRCTKSIFCEGFCLASKINITTNWEAPDLRVQCNIAEFNINTQANYNLVRLKLRLMKKKKEISFLLTVACYQSNLYLSIQKFTIQSELQLSNHLWQEIPKLWSMDHWWSTACFLVVFAELPIYRGLLRAHK